MLSWSDFLVVSHFCASARCESEAEDRGDGTNYPEVDVGIISHFTKQTHICSAASPHKTLLCCSFRVGTGLWDD